MILDERNRKNLIFLILQFLHEEGYEESLHLLEQDSAVFFDFSYFSSAILNGNCKEAEYYLSAFTSPGENTYSRTMFIELFKWKFDEAPDRSQGSEAGNVYSKDLRRIRPFQDDGFDDLVELFALEGRRIPEQDKAMVRAKLCADLYKLAESNPSLRSKLVFPQLNESALLSLIFLICPNCNGRKVGLKEDLICIILQFLHEAKYKNTLHKLEQETKVFFNLDYLVEVMRLDQLDKAEKYLTAFTETHENKYSRAMFLEIQKLKSLESTEREITTPSGSLDNMPPKKKLHDSVAMLARKNPVLKDKLKLPSMEKSRLSTLMKQTIDWWGPRTCKNPNTLENIPVVPYLCDPPSSLEKKLNGTRPRKKVDTCKLIEINDRSECNALVLPDFYSGEKITRLTYSPSGDYILALAEDATHKLWTWSSSQIEFCKDTLRILKENVFPTPRLHQPQSGKTMKNEIANSVQNSTSCFAIKSSYLYSTSGGKISIFDLKSNEKLASFGSPTPTATYFIFIPGDLLVLGLDNGSIFIHCFSSRKVIKRLEGHDQRITCLAFSRCFKVLISAGADGKICVWSTKSWVKLTSIDSIHRLCTRDNHKFSSLITHIQFDPYQIELLVVHEGWISVLKAPSLDCLLQWVPDEESGSSITYATYSSDGEIVYVGFRSGFIKILNSRTWQTICIINLTAFTRPMFSNIRLEVYPVVVATHPSNPSQISAGLSNGKVIVLQPLGSGGWGEPAPPQDNGDHCY